MNRRELEDEHTHVLAQAIGDHLPYELALPRRPDLARGRRARLKTRAHRTIPLHAEAHDALRRWYTARPTATTDALFVSLRARRSAVPQPMSPSAVGNVVGKHAAAAGIMEDRRTAHALRHTFCTMLAKRGVALEIIRALAGHIDIRTTQIYVDVTDQRKAEGIAALERTRPPLAV